ncbi:hypothetical protein GCM10010353_27710 [Streptomyces chryseus]|nr:hypothetical protein GCM10010353_27710 [Streptomyces chryseus]
MDGMMAFRFCCDEALFPKMAGSRGYGETVGRGAPGTAARDRTGGEGEEVSPGNDSRDDSPWS